MSISSSAANRTMYIGLGLGVTVLSGTLSYLLHKYLKRDVMPLKWRRVGILEQVNIFPIKSCGPLELSPEENVIFCEVLGLRIQGIQDRALMIVNEKYEMITARVYPKMVLIHAKIVGATKLLITADHMEPLQVDFATLVEEAPRKDIRTSVWGSKLNAVLCGEKYDKWVSRFILNKDSGLHLLYYPHAKPVKSTNADLAKEPYIIQQDSGTFSDGTSYMLINLASVQDLNKRIPRPVDPLQFRGNFHLKMDKNEEYAEDHWQWIRIGNEAIFRKVAPCTRCILPNINVKTGERDPVGDPLKTLKTYRMVKNYPSPAMGIHMGLRQAGPIKANDVIYVEDI